MSESQKFVKTDEAIEVENMLENDPMEVIKAAAEGIGMVLNDPKPNCKHCHGRGYIGRNAITKEPIPCKCIFPKYETQKPSDPIILPQNRAERRRAMKNISNKKAKEYIKIMKEMEFVQ